MPICPALRGIIRPPHHLGGVAKSRSLFVATPPLILALLDDAIKTFETGNDGVFSGTKTRLFPI
jgi:hypothetical protein